MVTVCYLCVVTGFHLTFCVLCVWSVWCGDSISLCGYSICCLLVFGDNILFVVKPNVDTISMLFR